MLSVALVGSAMNSSLKKEAGEFEKSSQVLISIVISSSKGTRRGGVLVYP